MQVDLVWELKFKQNLSKIHASPYKEGETSREKKKDSKWRPRENGEVLRQTIVRIGSKMKVLARTML